MNWYRLATSLRDTIGFAKRTVIALMYNEPSVNLELADHDTIKGLIEKHGLNTNGYSSDRLAAIITFLIREGESDIAQ